MRKILVFFCLTLMLTAAKAGTPLWTFEPLTATTISVAMNATATVQYRVTNQSRKTHTLTLKPISGITQTTTGLGICGNPFVLTSQASCTLSLLIDGNQLNRSIADGPVVCQSGSLNQCYRPGAANVLRVTLAPPATEAVLSTSGSPLTITLNGSGQLTITNTSAQLTATNITSDFTGTALDGNVTESGNTCANVSPGASCTLTFVAGNTLVPQTNFTIQGSNTQALTAAMTIESGSTLSAINPTTGTALGGAGFILTGTGLTGATAVTFDGIAATSIQVVNSTTVTGVTPSHAAGLVDVIITTPAGGATLNNGYTYQTTAVGQLSGGGKIACLNGGFYNLIAATADISAGIVWGGFGTAVGAGAQSTIDGASNTAAIITALGNNGGIPYAAELCHDYEVDSQGNTPCEAGNTCYNDWFLPANDGNPTTGQLNCLYTNRVAIGGFVNNPSYWTSTESTGNPTTSALAQSFATGPQFVGAKSESYRVRCVRALT